MEKQGEKYDRYSYEELSAFCLQIALLLEAAVPLEEGLTIMAEDAAEEKEKAMLLYMAEGAELGDPFFKVLEDTGVFPPYIVRMARLGQQTGTLDQMMKSLSDYYEKEARLLKAVKNAATYPAMMILMLLVVLFVLFTKVMPVFSRVYEQLGASLPPAAVAAIRLGGIFKRRSIGSGSCNWCSCGRDMDCCPFRKAFFTGGKGRRSSKKPQPYCQSSCAAPLYLCAGSDLKERAGTGKEYGISQRAG